MNADDRTNNLKFSSQEYSDSLTNRKQTITIQRLSQHFDNVICSMDKYTVTNQLYLVNKLQFIIETLRKERDLVKMGLNTFICFEDIQNYIDNNSKDVVNIIELENYRHSIPDEFVEIVHKTNHVFNKFYIVYTDYTKEIQEQVIEKKGPILFGAFQDTKTKVFHERFYLIGEWEYSYCDSTFKKIVEKDDFAKYTSIPDDAREFQSQFTDEVSQNGSYKVKENRFFRFLKKINPF